MTAAPGQIHFGTDGWRAVIADDYTFDNVALVGSAIRQYLEETAQSAKPVLIGYDNRFAAEAFAAHLANHLTSAGLKVLLAAEPCPTPAIACAVQEFNAGGALMLTASHNPYYYQGLKFIPYFAGPAMPETTDRITSIIAELAPQFVAPGAAVDWHGERVDLRPQYFARLDQVVNAHSITSLGRPLIYTAMHGTGAGYVDRYLRERGVEVRSLHTERDPLFGGRLPDPGPRSLADIAAALPTRDGLLLAGTDGDADRFGLLDEHDEYYGANKLLPLLAEYLLTYRKLSGDLVRTVCTSHMLDALAQKHHVGLIETPVGFKYVGAELRKGALIGGEESGGLSIKGHVPEKDGILAIMLALELVATTGEELAALQAQLHSRFGDWQYRRIDLVLSRRAKQALLQALSAEGGSTFLDRQLTGESSLDGRKFLFADGSWVMLRPSGTEDVLRVYLEAQGTAELERLSRAVSTYIEHVITEL